ncbi:hypothetical protein LX32DRAFT_417164 [Colletotrichum zoysiae]|uniref:Uncharacterized protein n=1 Tax=Colletotrichum zoysiae TaxID=1216348 RepID=A0AAD9M0E8_9PEZI|nr:hypothetical protein LX32DRAFT_417164 [Colletotrichum zoysiae]
MSRSTRSARLLGTQCLMSSQQTASTAVYRLYGSVGRALVSYSINMTLPPGRDIQRSQVRALLGTFPFGPLGLFLSFLFLFLFTFFLFRCLRSEYHQTFQFSPACAYPPKTSILSTTLIVRSTTHSRVKVNSVRRNSRHGGSGKGLVPTRLKKKHESNIMGVYVMTCWSCFLCNCSWNAADMVFIQNQAVQNPPPGFL